MVDPRFSGSWKCEGKVVVKRPPNMPAQGIVFGILLVGSREPPNWVEKVQALIAGLGRDCASFGLAMKNGGAPMNSSAKDAALTEKFEMLKRGGCRIVICPLIDDCYGDVKFAADSLGVTTQCLKWKNVDRTPSGYWLNVALKINTKLGGMNHTLASRLAKPPSGPATFQEPPSSISWLFDKPCMLMGIDVSHAEKGSDAESVAAVVASMDGSIGQYAAHIALQVPQTNSLG